MDDFPFPQLGYLELELLGVYSPSPQRLIDGKVILQHCIDAFREKPD